MDNRSIGVFDSGLGGLTVVKELMRALPFENITYLGDTARTPYGTKTKETIIRFSLENTGFLRHKGVKMAVVACNTSSAIALKKIKSSFKMPVIGVIDAGAKAAVKAAKGRTIGVIGTKATISSGAYESAIKKISPKTRIFVRAAPLLVPLVEEGWLKEKETEAVLRKYLRFFRERKIGVLVLGCTHYPLLKPLIKKIMPGVGIIDSAGETAREVVSFIGRKNFQRRSKIKGRARFFVTDTPEAFNKVGKMFLKKSMVAAKKIALKSVKGGVK
ncbi:MAG TPA: glutamate racemase [bacterium]|nr:glutamate racemase [bacterium]